MIVSSGETAEPELQHPFGPDSESTDRIEKRTDNVNALGFRRGRAGGSTPAKQGARRAIHHPRPDGDPRMRAIFASTLIAATLAALIAINWTPRSTEAAILEVQLAQRAPHQAHMLQDESLELQALFLDYADDPLLSTKAQLALLRYPEMSRPILALYGAEPAFMDALREHGEHIIPPIHHLMTNESVMLNLRKHAETLFSSAIEFIQSVRGTAPDTPSSEHSRESDPGSAALTPETRGWYAVMFINREGHDFLGQFVLTSDGQVARVQSERLLESVNAFFAGGIRGLETRVRRDEEIGLGDVGWAALDVAVGVSAFKLVRLGRNTAVAGRTLHFTQRNAALGASLLRGSAIGTRIAKYGAPAVLAYVAIRHPGVLNALLADAAGWLGLPTTLVQALGWTILLLPVILLARLLLGPMAALLIGFAKALQWIQRIVILRKSTIARS